MASALFNVVLTIMFTILTIYLAMQIIPTFAEVVKNAVSSSPEVVNRDLAGLITLSAAAPYKIAITYNPSDATYNIIKVSERFVSVEKVENEKVVAKATPSKTAVDLTEPNVVLENANKIGVENIVGKINIRPK